MVTEPDRYPRGVCRGGRRDPHRPRRGAAPPPADAAGHPAAGLPGRRGHQPVDAAVGASSEVLDDIDVVLVMSVNPGFGGQAFLPQSESKIARVRELLTRAGVQADIEVDGGIDQGNIGRVVAAGATMIVAGRVDFRRRRPRIGGAHPQEPAALEAAARGPAVTRSGTTPGAGPVRGNRPDAGRLPRQLLRVVRGRAHRPAAGPRLVVPGDGGGGVRAAGHRSPLCVPPPGAIR